MRCDAMRCNFPAQTKKEGKKNKCVSIKEREREKKNYYGLQSAWDSKNHTHACPYKRKKRRGATTSLGFLAQVDILTGQPVEEGKKRRDDNNSYNNNEKQYHQVSNSPISHCCVEFR